MLLEIMCYLSFALIIPTVVILVWKIQRSRDHLYEYWFQELWRQDPAWFSIEQGLPPTEGSYYVCLRGGYPPMEVDFYLLNGVLPCWWDPFTDSEVTGMVLGWTYQRNFKRYVL